MSTSAPAAKPREQRVAFDDSPLLIANMPVTEDNGLTGWVEIFRVGDYGTKGKYATDDLDRMVANFEAGYIRVPLTFDHDYAGPAFGFAAEVRRNGDILEARFRGVDEWTREAVNRGMWCAISIEAYRGTPSGLPEGVEMSPPVLSAVTLLGAAQPAVKGLREPKFSDRDDSLSSSTKETAPEAATPNHEPEESTHMSDTPKTPDPNIEAQVADLQTKLEAAEAATATATQKLEAALAERDQFKAEAESQKSTAADLSAKVDKLTAAFAASEAKAAKAEFDDRFRKLAREGRVAPAEKEIAFAQFSAARAIDGTGTATKVKFGDKELSNVDLFWQGLESRPERVVEMSQLADPIGPDRETGAPTDPVGKLADAIKARMSEKGITWDAAEAELRRERPALFTAAENAVTA